SPVRVSVHTTDASLRGRMFGHQHDLPVLETLGELVRGGISVDAQIVVVPGWNDGARLRSTLQDLISLAPGLRSVGVVPLGLTSHRKTDSGVSPPLRGLTGGEAEAALCLVEEFQRTALNRMGTRWAYGADELYLIAGRAVPGMDHYVDCPQAENGIGLLAALLDVAASRRASGRGWSGSGTLVTGSMCLPFLSEILDGTGYGVVGAENSTFGESVGVAGLLGGWDIIRRIGSAGEVEEPVCLPDVMFNREGLSLDGLTVGDIADAVGCRVVAVEGGLEALT
ncbi:DUF512 domain-containing protein, partial [Candidatus Fermentibacterales bacterium]|nr:DUF512 domain-containing protein [Candidatus Fermentibacterales bacterium]